MTKILMTAVLILVASGRASADLEFNGSQGAGEVKVESVNFDGNKVSRGMYVWFEGSTSFPAIINEENARELGLSLKDIADYIQLGLERQDILVRFNGHSPEGGSHRGTYRLENVQVEYNIR